MLMKQYNVHYFWPITLHVLQQYVGIKALPTLIIAIRSDLVKVCLQQFCVIVINLTGPKCDDTGDNSTF